MDYPRKQPRESNFELLRIICMITIIATHYYNLGVIIPDGEPASFNHLFIRFIGFGGRVGVDMFILISGYFLVEQKFRSIKAFQIALQCGLVSALIALVYYFFGQTDLRSVFDALFYAFTNMHWFISGYLLLYFFIDYLNALVHSISREKLLALIWTLLLFRSILPTLLGWRMDSSTLLLFVTLYMIAAYIRLYSPRILDSKYCLLAGLVIHWLCYAFSAVLIARQDLHPLFPVVANRISEKDDITVILCSVLIFAGFRKLDIGRSRFINALGASTFGVYLMHMHPFIHHNQWVDLLRTPQVYLTPWLVLHAPLSILAVFFFWAGVDMLYRRFLQDPLMRWVGRHWDAWTAPFRRLADRLLRLAAGE